MLRQSGLPQRQWRICSTQTMEQNLWFSIPPWRGPWFSNFVCLYLQLFQKWRMTVFSWVILHGAFSPLGLVRPSKLSSCIGLRECCRGSQGCSIAQYMFLFQISLCCSSPKSHHTREHTGWHVSQIPPSSRLKHPLSHCYRSFWRHSYLRHSNSHQSGRCQHRHKVLWQWKYAVSDHQKDWHLVLQPRSDRHLLKPSNRFRVRISSRHLCIFPRCMDFRIVYFPW